MGADAGCKHGDMKKKKLGDVTTVNITVLKSGVSTDGGQTYAMNVIPTEAVAGFDVRISPHHDMAAFEVIHCVCLSWNAEIDESMCNVLGCRQR